MKLKMVAGISWFFIKRLNAQRHLTVFVRLTGFKVAFYFPSSMIALGAVPLALTYAVTFIPPNYPTLRRT